MPVQHTLREITSILGGEVVGDPALLLNNVGSLTGASNGSISFLTDSKYAAALAVTNASAVIISEKHAHLTNLPKIVTDNPYAYFAKVSLMFHPEHTASSGIASSAIVDPTATIHATATIMANAYVAANATIDAHAIVGPGSVLMQGVTVGENSRLEANVTIYHDCVVGAECMIAAGSVIGADGFGFAFDHDRWVKIPQVGRVLIADHVSIGANTTIDRGALDDTVIEEGVKIDNLVQIGHNCVIGAHTVIAGCVGIAGSARIGKYCRIGGAAMVLGHLEIADQTTITPGTMITRSLHKSGTYTALMPFQEHEQWLKTAATIRRMGDLADRVKQLEQHLAKIEQEHGKN